MKKPTGKPTEREFMSRIVNLGKRAFAYRVEDASDLHGLNKGRMVQTSKKPSDFFVTIDGVTFYLEVKETTDPKGFPVSRININQKSVAVQVTAAGGGYFFFVCNLTNKRTYLAPASFILGQKGCIPWGSMEPYYWPGEQLCPTNIIRG